MLVSEEVEIKIINNNKKRLLDLGYDVSGETVKIKVSDLTTGSKQSVDVKCDICGNLSQTMYYLYNKSLKSNGIYSCANAECTNEKKKLTNLKKFGTEWASQNKEISLKTKKTNLDRWGTEVALHSVELKNKINENNIKKWGASHPMKSDKLKFSIKKNNLEKWGFESVLQNDEVREKIKKTNLERYGVENPLQNYEIREKIKKTNLERYGDENYNNREKCLLTNLERYGKHFTQTSEYINKLKITSIEKYGEEFPSKSDLVKKKIKKTKLNRHGNENYNNIDKIKSTNLLRWGDESALKNKEVRKKIELTNLEKYGFKTNLMTEDIILKRLESSYKNNKHRCISKYEKIIPTEYQILDYDDGIFIIKHTDHEFNIGIGLIYDRLKISNECVICTKCNPLNSNSSSGENEIKKWLESIGVAVESKRRDILNGKEIDIYLEEYKLGIEFNGLFWHSDRFKNKWYHRSKTEECNLLDIDLIHIFEDDWVHKKDIIKSIIKNRIGINGIKIYARSCQISEISHKACKKFLEDNHIQGYARSKFKYGLFKDGELISVMTLGERKTNSKSEFELIRFCNKLNTTVIGSASKLLKHFINVEKYKGKIISYADISIFSGKLYEKIGFKYIHKTKPNYFWIVDGVRHHRFKYNKRKLVDKYNADIDSTENDIMKSMGYYKIWSCGQSRYEISI